MLKLVNFYDKHKIALYILFAILILASIIMITQVSVNYDMAKYLPKDSITTKSIEILESDFSYPGSARVMVKDVTHMEALVYKEKIAAVDGVSSVIWLDDYTDITAPAAFTKSQYLDDYYKDGKALFLVEFKDGNYSTKTGNALLGISHIIDGNGGIEGAAEDSRFTRTIMSAETTKIMLVILPICLLILMLAGKTWIEPLLYIIAIGVAIALNMGTNLMFDSISYITMSMVAVLQLAISMDYSIFLFHRYLEEIDNGVERHKALGIAIRNSFTSIASSALTTVAGFLALVFMKYSIGFDLGIVLAKGIVFSFFCTLTFLPLLILSLHKLIDKTRHKSYIPKFKEGFVSKFKITTVVVMILVAIPCFFAQQNNSFLYGDTSGSAADTGQQQTKAEIRETFGDSEPVMILVPNDNIEAEEKLCDDLGKLSYVRSIQSLVTLTDPAIPRDILPNSVKEQFLSPNYSRIILFLNISGENEMTFSTTDELQKIVQQYFPDEWYMAGNSTSISDIKSTIEDDTIVITLFSLIAVALIILFAFRSISIPILLITVIECSIWINMSIPYFQGTKMVFIGYLVVSSIQLGATIDYAILMSHRYLEFRNYLNPAAAAVKAVQTAGSSVITSALILTVAGTAEGILSNISAISQIGFLLGRGAFLSGAMVLLVLPRLLVLCDKLILKTTMKMKNTELPKEEAL